ncbi:DNA repair protein RecO [candidate division WWE3 bacterium]|nr:DNA repair protein RecO [candidate division WWE3 bacterium]
MITQNERGWVMSRYPYGEGSSMLHVFTRQSGVVSVVAKSVRKPSSRRGGHVDLFNEIECSIRPFGEVFVLSEVTVVKAFESLKQDLHKLSYLYYFAELIELFIQQESGHHVLYDKLISGIEFIENHSTNHTRNLDEVARRFEIYLLRSLGFWADEVQGNDYPTNPSEQQKYNHQLIREVVHRNLKTPSFIDLNKNKK